MTDLESIANYTIGAHTTRPKLRFKKSPGREDNIIPVLKNQKDQFMTLQPKNEVLVNLQQQLKQDLMRYPSRSSKSRESLGTGQQPLAGGSAVKSRDSSKNIFDVRMDVPSARETLEAY